MTNDHNILFGINRGLEFMASEGQEKHGKENKKEPTAELGPQFGGTITQTKPKEPPTSKLSTSTKF
jgi:hypothetical protein